MGEPIEERSGHLGVAEHGGPFAEAQVCGDDDAGALVEFAQQVEEQRAYVDSQMQRFKKDDC